MSGGTSRTRCGNLATDGRQKTSCTARAKAIQAPLPRTTVPRPPARSAACGDRDRFPRGRAGHNPEDRQHPPCPRQHRQPLLRRAVGGTDPRLRRTRCARRGPKHGRRGYRGLHLRVVGRQARRTSRTTACGRHRRARSRYPDRDQLYDALSTSLRMPYPKAAASGWSASPAGSRSAHEPRRFRGNAGAPPQGPRAAVRPSGRPRQARPDARCWGNGRARSAHRRELLGGGEPEGSFGKIERLRAGFAVLPVGVVGLNEHTRSGSLIIQHYLAGTASEHAPLMWLNAERDEPWFGRYLAQCEACADRAREWAGASA
jgi:hypothetical protein